MPEENSLKVSWVEFCKYVYILIFYQLLQQNYHRIFHCHLNVVFCFVICILTHDSSVFSERNVSSPEAELLASIKLRIKLLLQPLIPPFGC